MIPQHPGDQCLLLFMLSSASASRTGHQAAGYQFSRKRDVKGDFFRVHFDCETALGVWCFLAGHGTVLLGWLLAFVAQWVEPKTGVLLAIGGSILFICSFAGRGGKVVQATIDMVTEPEHDDAQHAPFPAVGARVTTMPSPPPRSPSPPTPANPAATSGGGSIS